MRQLVLGATILAALAGPAYAQQKPVSAMSSDELVKKSAADAVDRQYRATMDKTSKDATETRVDPWSNMRGTDNTKPKR